MPSPDIGELICPSCRRPPEAWPVDVVSGVCANPRCGEMYPVLTGTDIRVVVGAPADWLHGSDPPLRFDLAPDVTAWLAGLERGSSAWEEAVRLGMYADFHYRQTGTALDRLYERFIEPIAESIGSAVDLGCGVGGFTSMLASGLRCPVVGLDSWPLALRFAESTAAHGEVFVPAMDSDVRLAAAPLASNRESASNPVRWVCGDLHNPPLAAGDYDLVTAISVFDSVADPALALGQASALLRPGGHLMMAQPDSWNSSATSPDHWASSSGAEWERLLDDYGFETVDRADDFGWTLSRNARTHFSYVSHGRLAILR